ncbi:putative ATP-grasp-modified RiPP [Streptosporangium sp. CA-135522]|uniref:putative ATP-grasp-modified RiPP n=1 Tax=Streptosporangium sp. CA-135522 TaxID=3240072 RepID=UPI003D8A449F
MTNPDGQTSSSEVLMRGCAPSLNPSNNDRKKESMTTAVAPWGLGRMSESFPEAESPYMTVQLDPATQLTRFHGADGVIVDMGKKTYATISMSKGGGSDGSGGSANVADDSNTDSA